MKRALCAALLLFACCSAFAQVDSLAVQRAANAVPVLRSMMKDPDSFVLERVFKSGSGPELYSICYMFRAHNSYGGYGDIGIVIQAWGELPEMNKKLKRMYKDRVIGKLVMDEKDAMGGPPMCLRILQTPHHVDITAEVKAALAPPPAPAPPAESAEDKAKHAQQYADCLKLAVDNPKVVCKQ